jgi:mRNA surveillance protein pelota
MRIISKDRDSVRLQIQDPEDLWHLCNIIEEEDTVKASTERKIKIGNDENMHVVRKKMTLTLRVEKVELQDTSLKVLGIITQGPEDVPKEHHSFQLTTGDELTLNKTNWTSWQKTRLEESQHAQQNILIVLYDRESATFARLKTQGHEILGSINGQVQKKQLQQPTTHFWKELATTLQEYDKRYKPNTIIAASAPFWKEYLMAEAGTLAPKIIYASVSDTQETAIAELLRRPELKRALANDRQTKELAAMENTLALIAKDRCAYGIDEVDMKVHEGAISNLLVSANLIKKERREKTYARLEKILKACEQAKAHITIITTPDAQKQLDGLGGIAGQKRW